MERALGDEWRLRLSVVFLSAVFIAIMGPFGTYDMYGLGTRFLYWGGLILSAFVPAVLLRETLKRRLSGPPTRRDIVIAFAISAAATPPIWAFNTFVMQFPVFTFSGIFEHFSLALLICLVPVGVRLYRRRSSEIIIERIELPASPAFLNRLEPPLNGPILRVSADGHQTQVFTPEGEARLRMRFSDVVEALADQKGAQIHRSHWVALDQISEVRADGRRYAVKMGCGSVVPVSLTGAGALREAGLLQD